jgi:acetolactate synthase-1/2/3 large subunit
MRFSDRTTGKADEFCKKASIIHIDIDPSEMDKNKEVSLQLVGDAARTLASLRRNLTQTRRRGRTSPWFSNIIQKRARKQQAYSDELTAETVLKTLRRIIPNKAIIATEVGQNQMWTALHFKAYSPRTFMTSGGLGTMGFGFPAAIGAKVAKPNTPVIDIAGDGSFVMNSHTLATSVREKIPVIAIILNNGMLGMVAQWQRLFFNRRYSAVELGDVPDFVKLAEAYGAQGIRAETIDEFEKAVKRGLRSEVTTIIDVPISPEENVAPIVPPGSSLNNMMLT